MRHHTKDKGDEGLGQVIGDLMSNGVQVAVPLSEHLPFDLIAIGEGGAMRRVQVRYRASADAAHLRCELGGWWADRHGNHRHAFDASAIDALAIYCPAPKTFVYLLADELPSAAVNLLLVKAKNGQRKRARDEYLGPWLKARSRQAVNSSRSREGRWQKSLDASRMQLLCRQSGRSDC